jgi:hypothetical protein
MGFEAKPVCRGVAARRAFATAGKSDLPAPVKPLRVPPMKPN